MTDSEQRNKPEKLEQWSSSSSYERFCEQLFLTVFEGSLSKLKSFIHGYRCPKGELQKILQSTSIALRSNHGREFAPAIVLASKYGHLKIVQFLIEEYSVNIDGTGDVSFDGFTIEGATALWCASGAGHMDIVRFLVESGADVNKTTNSNSTPLRAACFDGRIDIVRYLVKHHADITIPNRYKNNCLMISAYRGHLSVVEFLLGCGMNPNQPALANATALQFAAETGRADICRALVDAGAELRVNDSGLDQLFVAAEHGQIDIVRYMVAEPKLMVSRQRHIEALELLGSVMLNDKDKYDPTAGFSVLRQAIQMRADAAHPMPKTVLPPLPAYKHRKECETLEELDELQYDFELLELEGLIVRERLLGRNFAEITGPIVYRGAVYADMMQFDRCIELWLHALRIRTEQQQATAKDLLRLTQVMSQMISLRNDVPFRVAYEVMSLCCHELHRSRLLCRERRFPHRDVTGSGSSSSSSDAAECSNYLQNMHTALYLLALLCKVKMSADEERLTYKLVHSLVKGDFRLQNGHSLLHMACFPRTKIDNFHINSVVRVPNATVVKLLLICGANPNSLSEQGDTPFHCVVGYNNALPDFLTLESIINNLISAGVHADIRNSQGKTPSDIVNESSSGSASVTKLLLISRRKLSLQCLSARAVADYNLPLHCLPPGLAHFVSWHAPACISRVGIGPDTAASAEANAGHFS